MSQSDLRELFNEYLQKHHANISRIAKEIEVSNTYLSDFLNYNKDLSQRVSSLLESYIKEKEISSLIIKN